MTRLSPRSRAASAQGVGAVGKALAVVEAGRADRCWRAPPRAARRRRAARLRAADRRSGASRTGSARRSGSARCWRAGCSRSELGAGDPQMLEEGAAVPDQQHDRGDQDGEDQRLAARIEQARALGRFALWFRRRRHGAGLTHEHLINSPSTMEGIQGFRRLRYPRRAGLRCAPDRWLRRSRGSAAGNDGADGGI